VEERSVTAEGSEKQLEKWEKEVVSVNRWAFAGDLKDAAQRELERLRALRDAAGELDEGCSKLVDQICTLQICNWRMEESMLALCEAIGKRQPLGYSIGHLGSMTERRWQQAWAYCLALRHWISGRRHIKGYLAMLSLCDRDEEVRKRVEQALGERDELKELYVERYCMALELMLGNGGAREWLPPAAHRAAAAVIEEEIRKRDPEARILEGIRFDERFGSYSGIEPCHHKFFRRLDIVISSIGAGEWRAVMPQHETSAADRAAELESYLAPIAAWLEGRSEPKPGEVGVIFDETQASLGERDATKTFIASLLLSLMRSQQLRAWRMGEGRSGEQRT